MAPAVLFTKEVYGKDHLVRGSVKRPTPEFLAKTPMSPKLRAELDKLMNGKENYLAGKSEAEQIAFLQSMSYRDYLLKVSSEEHKSELQSLMLISYAVFLLKNKHNQVTPIY